MRHDMLSVNRLPAVQPQVLSSRPVWRNLHANVSRIRADYSPAVRMAKLISDTGFWNIDGSKFDKEHVFDPRLCDALLGLAAFLEVRRSYDFGCGHGRYVQSFRQAGIATTGFDGNPITSRMPHCRVQDLTDPNFAEKPLEFVLCLEVCEHVPAEFEDALINAIDRHLLPGGTVVLSWAVPRQPGFGHVNCRDNAYVISKMESKGYTYFPDDSEEMRKAASLWWFKKTIMVFQKAGELPEEGAAGAPAASSSSSSSSAAASAAPPQQPSAMASDSSQHGSGAGAMAADDRAGRKEEDDRRSRNRDRSRSRSRDRSSRRRDRSRSRSRSRERRRDHRDDRDERSRDRDDGDRRYHGDRYDRDGDRDRGHSHSSSSMR